MRDVIGTILTAKFGLVVILFFLPFLNFSCSPGFSVEISGIQMVTGDTITIEEPFTGQKQIETLEPEPYAAAAFGLAILGFLGTLLYKGRMNRLAGLLAGGGGATFLYLLKEKIGGDVSGTDMQGLVLIDFQESYWIAFVLLALAGLVGLITLFGPQGETARE
jgi:hypothetical protein